MAHSATNRQRSSTTPPRVPPLDLTPTGRLPYAATAGGKAGSR